MENKKSGVLEPELCHHEAPNQGDSVVGRYPVEQNSKMVRGEMLYKTPNTGKDY